MSLVSAIDLREGRVSRDLLGRALRALLALPEVTKDKFVAGRPEPERHIIGLAAGELGIDATDLGRVERAAIADLLQERLTLSAVGVPTTAQIEAASKRWGIPNYLNWQISISDLTAQQNRVTGVCPEELELTFHSPTSVQELPFLQLEGGISLFVRVLNEDEIAAGAPPHWCLALVWTDHGEHQSAHAWHIFQDDIEIDVANASPFDLLRAFVTAFGARISLRATWSGSFYTGPGVLDAQSSSELERPPHTRMLSVSQIGVGGIQPSGIVFLYAILLDKYHASLDRRGLSHAPLSDEPTPAESI